MNSPIINRIGQVFIPVSDIKRSATWYNRLFGLEGSSFSHEGRIYDVPTRGEARLTLDAHKPVTATSVQPLCFFWTADMTATKQFLVDNDVELVDDVQNGGSLYFLVFKDPDANLLMVCEPKDDSTRQRAHLDET